MLTRAARASRRDLHSWINVDADADTLFSAKQGTTAQPFLGEARLRLYRSNVEAYIDMIRCPTLTRTRIPTSNLPQLYPKTPQHPTAL